MTLLWPTLSEVIAAGGSYMFDRGPTHTPRYHQGDDIRIPVNTTVYASGEGVVTGVFNTGKTSGFGLYVQAQYGALQVRTAHLNRADVEVGERLTSSTVLGLSGGIKGTFGAGDSTGPHCHLETHYNGLLCDPKLYLASRASSSGGQLVPVDPIQEKEEPVRFIYAKGNKNPATYVIDSETQTRRWVKFGGVLQAFVAAGGIIAEIDQGSFDAIPKTPGTVDWDGTIVPTA